MFNVILVAADGSPTSRTAVDAAAEIAQTTGARLHIVSALDRSPDDESSAVLASLAAIASAHEVQAVVHAEKGDPTDVVLERAKHVNADLVVVGNLGMKGVGKVLGSVPNSVAHRASSSVLIVDTAQ